MIHQPNDGLNIDPKIAERIKKLLNLSRDKSASQGEIENATAAVNRLLMQYNLDLMDFENSLTQKELKIIEAKFEIGDYQTRHEANWAVRLYQGLAHYNMCKCIHVRMNRTEYDQGKIVILGQEHNIQIVYYLFHQVAAKIDILCRETWKNYKGSEKRNTFRRGFLIGAVEGICTKLYLQQKEQLAEEKDRTQPGPDSSGSGTSNSGNEQVYSGSRMLMVIDSNKQAIEKRVEELFGNTLKTGKKPRVSSNDGHAEGFKAGKSMELNKGVKNQSPKDYLN